jgi:hypothetical protein
MAREAFVITIKSFGQVCELYPFLSYFGPSHASRLSFPVTCVMSPCFWCRCVGATLFKNGFLNVWDRHLACIEFVLIAVKAQIVDCDRILKFSSSRQWPHFKCSFCSKNSGTTTLKQLFLFAAWRIICRNYQGCHGRSLCKKSRIGCPVQGGTEFVDVVALR